VIRFVLIIVILPVVEAFVCNKFYSDNGLSQLVNRNLFLTPACLSLNQSSVLPLIVSLTRRIILLDVAHIRGLSLIIRELARKVRGGFFYDFELILEPLILLSEGGELALVLLLEAATLAGEGLFSFPLEMLIPFVELSAANTEFHGELGSWLFTSFHHPDSFLLELFGVGFVRLAFTCHLGHSLGDIVAF
jgi:hypothetical protein